MRKLFTEQERQLVVDRYPTEGAKPIARDLCRSRESIVAVAERLGVRWSVMRPWTPEQDNALARLRAAGQTAEQIAEVIGHTAAAIGKRATQLGLTRRKYDREKRLGELTSVQPVKCGGVFSRWARARVQSGEHGWPPDLTPKEVSILNVLHGDGALSRKNLSLAIGEPAERMDKKRLMTHGGRSAMARLLARNLVTRCNLQNGRKRVVLYVLTLTAIHNRGTFPTVYAINGESARRGAGLPQRSIA